MGGIVSSVLGGGKGGGSQPSTTTTSGPSTFQQPFLNELFGSSQDLFRSDTPNFFPDSTVVAPNALQNLANQGILDFAAGPATEASGNALSALNFGLTDVLNPGSNQFLQAHAEGAIRPIFEALMEQVLPGIRGGARAVGQQGGSRQGIAEGLVTGKATQQAFDVTNRLFSDSYAQGLQQQRSALSLAPQTIGNTGILPQQLTAAVGGDFANFQQALLQDSIDRFTFEQNKPFLKLNEFANVVGTPQGGSSTSTSEPGSASTMDSIIGLGMQILPFLL